MDLASIQNHELLGARLGHGGKTYSRARHADASSLELMRELDRVMARQDIATHFQPLIDIQTGEIFGYEALTRGPSDSPLHSPLTLFDYATRCGRLVELEQMLVPLIVSRFEKMRLPGRLFLNLTSDTFSSILSRREAILTFFGKLDFPPNRVVIELTETRPTADPDLLIAALAELRREGFSMALDDLGEGFSSLRRWSEMRPDFVKLDRHFVEGLHRDPLKQQFVRSVLEMAKQSGATIIAEGLEEEVDLRVLQSIGVTICQGYLLGKPVPAPRGSLRPEIKMLLANRLQGSPREYARANHYGKATTAGELSRRNVVVTAEHTCAEVLTLFSNDPQLYSLPVLDSSERVIGILRSMDVQKRANERFFMDVYGRRSCENAMDRAPLLFDHTTTLRTISDVVANLDERQMVDGFIVTREGKYMGVGRISDLLKAVSDLQVFSARYSNPLTLLPGNVPIDSHIEELLHQKVPFVVVHWDLDRFKPFNDLYGYRAGDEIILFTSRILREICDSELDFLGHIGGDDFVSVFCSENWEERIQLALQCFDEGIGNYFTGEHRAANGFTTKDRAGNASFFALTSLSAGVLRVEPGAFELAAEVARMVAGAKHMAKEIEGSAYFVERRGHAPTESGSGE